VSDLENSIHLYTTCTALPANKDGKTVAAMDVLVPGVGEIMGGSQREERLDKLIEMMKLKNLDPKVQCKVHL
jgi:aspartyl/asparaginyl-tRNA synthetase